MHYPKKTGKRGRHRGARFFDEGDSAPESSAKGSARASACEARDYEQAIVHSALPTPLPAGTIIADVELEPGDVKLRL